jgi:hypothetical protein
MKKLIIIATLFLMSIALTSFIKSDRNVPVNMDVELYNTFGYVMLPEIVVTYDTVKCKCEVTIKDRPGRRGMEFGQRGRGQMNPRMGQFQRGRMNPMVHKGDTTKFERPMMMGRGGMEFGQRGRMMNPRMGQMDTIRQKQMIEHRQLMFKGDTTKFERPMKMNHR